MKKLIKNKIKNFIIFIISLIEYVEYYYTKVDPEDPKILNTNDLKDIEIKTNIGWSPVSFIHKTIPYKILEIKLENNVGILTADKHIMYLSNNKQVFADELKIGQSIKTEYGNKKIKNISLVPYPVSMYDISVEDQFNKYYANGILSHNTTTTSAFLAWYLCFHTDRNIAVLANKYATTVEIVAKIIDIFKGLPFFLKPGIINFGKTGMRLDNGCMLMSQATTKTAQVGFTIHVLYADEFAHIPNNIVNEFWRSTYPTLSSSDISQCIISSTPNGITNKFYELWDGALRKTNSFYSSRVDWWEIPGHDEAWAEQMRKDFGPSEFAQEFELQFNVSGRLLLQPREMSLLCKLDTVYKHRNLLYTKLGKKHYDNLYWHPKFDPNQEFHPKTDKFLISVDISEGDENAELKDSDYNVAVIYKIVPKSIASIRKMHPNECDIRNMFRFVQVGLYRDNVKDEEICAKVVRTLAFEIFPEDSTKVLIEMNFNGKNFMTHYRSHKKYDQSSVVFTYHSKAMIGDKLPYKKPGYKSGNDRDKYVKKGRDLIEQRLLIPNDNVSVREFKSFGKNAKGKYMGISCHDDTSMANLNISRFYDEQEQYEEVLEEILENLEDYELKNAINNALSRYESEDGEDIDDEDFYDTYDTTDYGINNYNQNFYTPTYRPSSTFIKK